MARRKQPKTLVSRVVKVDGKDIHLLASSDGTPVSEQEMQEYALSLTIKKNRAVEAGQQMEEQRRRHRESQQKTTFVVPKHLYKEFTFDLYTGLDFCVRKYGASAEDIKKEAKRIAPHVILG